MVDAVSDEEPLMRLLAGLARLKDALATLEARWGEACPFCHKRRAYGHCSYCPMGRAQVQLAGALQLLEAQALEAP